MDLFAHACYSATLCSQSGLAGGRQGLPGKRWFADATVWWSVFFGLVPDIASMWIPFAIHAFSGTVGIFFHHFGGVWLEIYRWVHSLLPALLLSGVLFFLRRRLCLPSLAWSVHILCDAVSHSTGKWQTMPLYPLTKSGIRGVPFWEHGWVMPAYWGIIVAIWVVIIIIRRPPKGASDHAA